MMTMYVFQVMVVGMIKSLFIILLFISLITAHADSDHDRAKILLEAGDILPLQSILNKAQKLHQGKILEVELETEQNQLVYEIELLLSNGSIVELLFDAKTGVHLSTEYDD